MFRLIVILCFPFFIQAQTESDSIAFMLDLDDFIITAQYEPTHYKNALAIVSIIKAEELNQRAPTSLKQALELTPSIRLYEDPILGTTITMRGISSSNVAVLVDNVPVIGRLNGAIDVSQIPINNIERIEIVEGPLSAIYGNNASGGVINVITKKTQINKVKVNASTLIESIGVQNYNASVGYQLNKLFLQSSGQYFNYSQFPTDSLRLTNDIQLSDGSTFSQSKYPFNPKSRLNYSNLARYNFSEDHYLFLKYDHIAETVNDFGIIKRPQFNPYANDLEFNTKRDNYSLQYKNNWDNFFLNSIISINNFSRTIDDNRYYIESQEFDSLLYTQEFIRFKNYFTNTNLTFVSQDKWSILFGLNVNNEIGQGDRILDITRIDSTTASFLEVAPYANLKYNYSESLSLSLAMRYQNHSNYGNNLTTSLQSKIKINNKFTARASIAQGYRSPTLKELYIEFIDINHNIIGNLDLSPEKSLDAQLTLTYNANDQLSYALNSYFNTIENQINLIEYETLKFQYSNIDRYKVFGFQPSFTYDNHIVKYNLRASIGFWSTSLDTDEAPQFGQVIDISNQLRIQPTLIDIAFNINHRYIGSQPNYRLEGGEVILNTIEAYNLVDTSIELPHFIKQLKVNLGIKNILNIQSINVTSGSNGNVHSSIGQNAINQGRSWYINSSLTF